MWFYPSDDQNKEEGKQKLSNYRGKNADILSQKLRDIREVLCKVAERFSEAGSSKASHTLSAFYAFSNACSNPGEPRSLPKLLRYPPCSPRLQLDPWNLTSHKTRGELSHLTRGCSPCSPYCPSTLSRSTVVISRKDNKAPPFFLTCVFFFQERESIVYFGMDSCE